ncbi:DUF2934 domain-containing protein [Kaarinaea lacus]
MPTAQTTATSKRTAKTKKPTLGKTKTTTSNFITPEQRVSMIAEAAYFMAEKRGFSGGDPNADWLCAESEIDHMLTNQ